MSADECCRKIFIGFPVTVVIPAITDFDGTFIGAIGADQAAFGSADPDTISTLIGVIAVAGLTYR